MNKAVMSISYAYQMVSQNELIFRAFPVAMRAHL